LCGASRPGHFRGVVTIVSKLLNIVQPDRMYLGQKDAQQCAVIKQLVRDLNFPVKVIIIPTVREKDGLAKSSRNAYLSSQQRKEAAVLYQSLRQAAKDISAGERSAATIAKTIRRHIQSNSSAKIDYIACVNAETLQPVKKLQGKVLLALAVFFDKTRLIDNIIINVT